MPVFLNSSSPRKSGKYSVTWILLVSLIIVFPALSDERREHSLKAAFIANLSRFVEWSGDKSTDKQSKINICILGEGTFADAAMSYNHENLSKSGFFVIEKNISNIASHCHILFINQSETVRLESIISSLKGKQILTVGDSEDFSKRGVMLGALVEDGRVKFIVNKQAIADSGLYIDSSFLELAYKVIR